MNFKIWPGSTVSLGAGTGKGLADHFNKCTFVYTYIFAAAALNLPVPHGGIGVFLRNPRLVAAQDFSRTDLVILPKLLFAGRTADY